MNKKLAWGNSDTPLRYARVKTNLNSYCFLWEYGKLAKTIVGTAAFYCQALATKKLLFPQFKNKFINK